METRTANRDIHNEGIGLYVHVPFCTVKCPYCDFYSVPISGWESGRLIDALLEEFDLYGDLPGVETIYIGGGSPSCLPGGQMCRLIESLIERCGVPEEFTVEVNPGQIGHDTLVQWRGLGVNRLSIGAQSLVADELKTLGRRYESSAIIQAVGDARRAGFENISCDLIFAIPGSTVESWRRSLQGVIDLGVEHVSAYSLSYEHGTVFTAWRSEGRLSAVDEETDRAMYELAIDLLCGAGLKQYEISNFAREEMECRHNLVYWANKPYLGIGPSAGSFIGNRRWLNVSDIDRYLAAVAKRERPADAIETLSPIELACETAVLMLRRVERGLDFDEYKRQTDYDAQELFSKPLEILSKQGLLLIDLDRARLTRSALPIANTVLCEFASA